MSDSLISVKRSRGSEVSAGLLAGAFVQSITGNTKRLIEEVEEEEQRLLKERRSANTNAISNFRTVLYIVFTLLVLLMMVLVQKLRVEVIADKETYRVMQYNTSLMDNIHDAVMSTDKDFAIVSWNRKAQHIFGWTEEEVKGKTVAAMMNPVYKEGSTATVFKQLLKQGAWEGEVSLEKKNRESLTMLLSISTIKKENGKMTGTVAIARDITPRKQIEEQLKKFNAALGKQVEDRQAELKHAVERLVASEKKYKLLFESNPLPMLMITLPDMNITDVNEAAVQQYGYSREAFVLRNMKDISHPEDDNSFVDFMKDETLGYHNVGTWKHLKKNRSVIFVEIFAYGMLLDGRKMKLMLAHDITQKIEADNKLKQYLEEIRMLTGHLQEIREEERKSIAREIHDELGQQLTVLKMEVAWIVRKLDETELKFEKKLTDLLDTIDGTMRSVRRICAELRPTLLDDLGLIAAMEWHAKQFESASGINVNLDTPVELFNITPEIKTGVYRIFQESLTNVARHAEAKKVDVRLILKDNSIVMHIVDDGKGFDIPLAGKKRTLGILGMKERSITMGGEYVISSNPGRGTTVMVCIPMEENRMILNKKTG